MLRRRIHIDDMVEVAPGEFEALASIPFPQRIVEVEAKEINPDLREFFRSDWQFKRGGHDAHEGGEPVIPEWMRDHGRASEEHHGTVRPIR